ncbi:hypothetical protein RCS94_02070 [Orbaceae bacterium ac157xtp]
MLIAQSSYGALSATSANTIKGSAPWFTGQSGAKKLGFIVNGTPYSESLNNINPTEIKEFNTSLKLSDFTVTNLTAADFSPTNDYADSDGDIADPTTPFSMNPRTFVWKDRTGALIPTANYNKPLGCGSDLKLPLILEITLPKVKVRSRYGNPRESVEMNLVQRYKIGAPSGICFAKPNSLDWVSAWGVSGNPTRGGGYNQAQFDPDNGFKASLSTKFPTTGFPGAEFTLVMVGSPTDYTFTHNGGTAVTVDGGTGKVTLNSKPSGAVTIKAKHNSAPPLASPHEYTFDPRTVWVVPKGSTSMTYADAKTTCGGESNIPSRAQLTNSPQKNAPQGWSFFENYSPREVGGGVFGEWGIAYASNYPESQWSGNWQWTRDLNSLNSQFVADTILGYVVWRYTSDPHYVVCLE